MIDTSAETANDTPLQALEDETETNVNGCKRIITARWSGMPIHCNYCIKEGHRVRECPRHKARQTGKKMLLS